MIWRLLPLFLALPACVGTVQPTGKSTADAAEPSRDEPRSGASEGGTGAARGGDAGTNAPANTPLGPTSDAGTSSRPGEPGDSPSSTLPVPPGDANKPRPTGTSANLKVLSWAGLKGAVSYTFDDGQPSHLEHWEELKATKARMSFFITTAYREMSPTFDAVWQDVAAAGSEVGNHTVNHCYYSGKSCGVNGKTILSPKGKELADCDDYIQDITGQTVWTAATPFGDSEWSAETKSRFMLTRGTISGSGGDGMVAPKDDNDPQNMPTLLAQEGDSAQVFSDYIDDARDAGKWAILTFHSIGPTSQSWFATVDVDSITDSIAHGQKLGDVWVDSMLHVGAYWLAEKTLAAAKPESSGAETRWSWQVPANFPKQTFLRVQVDGGSLKQNGKTLRWDGHGYYEVAFDVGSLSWSP